MYQIYLHEFISSIILLYASLPQHLEYFQQVSFFHFLTCVNILLHLIHPPTPFSQHIPLPLVSALPLGRTCSALLFSDFLGKRRGKIKWKHDILAWNKDSYTGSFFVIQKKYVNILWSAQPEPDKEVLGKPSWLTR
jgi:hypothetical protein